MERTVGRTVGRTKGAQAGAQAQAGIIDAFDLARLGKEASGSLPLARFGRAMEGLPLQPRDETGAVRWTVRGETGKHGEPLLHIHVRAAPVLVCQRCTEPFVCPIDAHVSLHLVRSEAELDHGLDEAAQEADDDADGIDDVPEKVVGSRYFDLLEQVEDELILNIPYVPRHDVCPGAPLKTSAGTPADGADAEKRPSPFAVLEKLKQKH